MTLNTSRNRDMASIILSFVVLVIGAIVMVGWITDIQVVKNISPNWATMKFTTALCFFLSGLVLFSIVDKLRRPGGSSKLLLLVAPMTILLLMGAQLASVLVGVETGIEELFVGGPKGFIRTSAPSAPSVGTMSGFILISVAGLLSMLNTKGLTLWLRLIGWATILIGTLAVIGYITNMPVLYYTSGGLISAMAMHTALLFMALGAGLALLAPQKKMEADH